MTSILCEQPLGPDTIGCVLHTPEYPLGQMPPSSPSLPPSSLSSPSTAPTVETPKQIYFKRSSYTLSKPYIPTPPSHPSIQSSPISTTTDPTDSQTQTESKKKRKKKDIQQRDDDFWNNQNFHRWKGVWESMKELETVKDAFRKIAEGCPQPEAEQKEKEIYVVDWDSTLDGWKADSEGWRGNPSPYALLVPVFGIYLPPYTSFSISSTPTFLNSHAFPPLDLLLLDPPWPNRSVRRSKSYKTSWEPHSLLSPPFTALRMNPGGLVGVWVTNNPAYLNFVVGELFEGWGLEWVGEWCWVKTTVNGESVVPWREGRHRKGYELLMIGKRKGESGAGSLGGIQVEVPRYLMLLSVPSKEHSRKPMVGPLLENYVRKNGESIAALEMFARNLVPGWCSWGWEALKFMEERYIEVR
ncbi:Methyltransferase-like protein 4 [Chytridiales sp. JEL 0842]|nr:Methyltransferase-like protein 4 [Chytridiales sp. JEL 0842]